MSWVTWSISNWQFLLWCLLFQSWMMGSRTFFSVSQQLRPKLSAKWILSILLDLPFTRKTEESVYFSILQMIVCKTEQIHKMTTIFTQIVVLSENRCRFVNLFCFSSSYIFLSLRKITWLNSQDFHVRTQNEELGQSLRFIITGLVQRSIS